MKNELDDQWSTIAIQLQQAAAFHLALQDSNYEPLLEDSWAKMNSFDDFRALVGTFVEMNDAMLEILGYDTPEERMMFLFHQNEEFKKTDV